MNELEMFSGIYKEFGSKDPNIRFINDKSCSKIHASDPDGTQKRTTGGNMLSVKSPSTNFVLNL